MVKKRACVFISGAGTNLKSIINYSRDYNFPININLIISNNKSAKGIYFAKKFSIPHKIINQTRDRFEQMAIKELRNRKINLICLAGFMKVLTKNFIRNFNGKIVNIHPSLLPKYKGLNTYKRAIEKGDKLFGCTVHYVNEKLDSGKIITKKRVYIANAETVEKLKKKVQIEEYKAYAIAIRKIYNLN
jgi:formyltetrahydrofolate-dependent phosphoribosylglycinamide formyltransferase